MDHFFIITNRQKDPALEKMHQIRKYLEEQGKTCYLQEVSELDRHENYKYTDAGRIPEKTECVLVLGGDGTLLQASRDLVETELPLIGINLGTLGYLAEIEFQNVFPALDRVISGDYFYEDRMMLSGEAMHHRKCLLKDVALNDIVIARCGRLRVIDFNILVDDNFLCSYRADGIIISTPTGSTGYSLSAGGPIVAPEASLMVLTAIAPHTLNSRPIVLPDHVKITIEIGGRYYSDDDGAEVTFDGDTSARLYRGDRITVTKSLKKTKLVRVHHTSFVNILREKMN